MDFLSFGSTKMPDALYDKCACDSPEQHSIEPWSHTRDSLSSANQTVSESGFEEKKGQADV